MPYFDIQEKIKRLFRFNRFVLYSDTERENLKQLYALGATLSEAIENLTPTCEQQERAVIKVYEALFQCEMAMQLFPDKRPLSGAEQIEKCLFTKRIVVCD